VYLQQVLLNLFVNAMDAMKDTPVANRLLTVSTLRDDSGEIEVVVTDNGHGIPPDKLSGIFESFYSTKTDGMGLGLSIARSIVKTHGGRIWAEDRPDGGAAFHFKLRVA
jgi:signal transduction histidine kinase